MPANKKIQPTKRNRDYWRQRELKQHKINKANARKYEKQIQQQYKKTLDIIQKEINSFYQEYADENGLTLSEARRRIKAADATKWMEANEYFKNNPHMPEAQQRWKLIDATARINRLELLKARIGKILIEQGEDLEKYFQMILDDEALKELERQAGIFGEFIGEFPEERLKAIVNASFHSANWSDRIWSYQDELQGQLNIMLTKALIVGRNPKHPEFVNQLVKHFNTSRYNVERLMHTEMARVQTQVQMDSFERNGYEYYEYICCGGGSGKNPFDPCERCKALDGKVFKVSEAVVGENAVPLHPQCHCSQAAYYGEPTTQSIKGKNQ